MRYTRALCAHFKCLSSPLGIDLESIPKEVSKLSLANDPTFKDIVAEYSLLMSMLADSESHPSSDVSDFSQFHHLRFRTNREGAVWTDMHGNQHIPVMVPASEFLYGVSLCSGSLTQTHKLWAGLSKLKMDIGCRDNRTKPSMEQVQSHYHSIVDGLKTDPDSSLFKELQEGLALVSSVLCNLRGIRDIDQDTPYKHPLWGVPASSTARTATVQMNGRFVHMTIPLNSLACFNIRTQLGSPLLRSLYYEDSVEFCSRIWLNRRASSVSFDVENYRLPPELETLIPLGIVRFIPWPGLKERVVTVPAEIMQCLSYGLGQKLKCINSAWSCQGVDSHVNTCSYLQSLIASSNGRLIFDSADQSNFTDRLPYRLCSRIILETFVREGYISNFDLSVMDKVAEGPVLIPEVDNEITHYGVGTPMGTYPSFPLASMTNGAIYSVAYFSTHGWPKDEYEMRKQIEHLPCRIIGDDIVSWDHEVFLKYSQFMNAIGCQIVPEKCQSSTVLAEMCSKWITPLGVFEQKRVDKTATASDLSSLAHNYDYYGEDFLQYVSALRQAQLHALKQVPFPYGLAPPLSDKPFWANRPRTRKLIEVIERAKQFSPSVIMNRSDYQILLDRRRVSFPKDFSFEFDASIVRYTSYDMFPIMESIRKDIVSLSKEVLDTRDRDLQDSLLSQTESLIRSFNRLDQYLSETVVGYIPFRKCNERSHLLTKVTGNGESSSKYRKILREIQPGLLSTVEEWLSNEERELIVKDQTQTGGNNGRIIR